ncbi:hypothetical protein [Archangium primigenium]|uniref:hypothetical protein n=1 Tax=[Archangium] primigenium TaxID=2792470 RepID=UPI00195B9CCF|nr:hypothetical protein [Archangium primigenium]MBM7112136.1 hypothetical protein [Archangium primigenium]
MHKTLNLLLRPLFLLCMLGGLPASAQSLSGDAESSTDVRDAEYAPMQCPWCEPPESPDPPSVPILHGYEINLPLLRMDMLPPGWMLMPVGYGDGHIWPISGDYRADMNWGGGNVVFNAIKDSWYDAHDFYHGRIVTIVDPGTSYVPIAQVMGYYENVDPGLVRGSVEMIIPNQPDLPDPAQGQVVVALQVQTPTDWRDVATSSVIHITNIRQMHEIEATIAPYQNVRFEVRVKAHPSNANKYMLWKVRMFGAECYPDFFNNAQCL